MGEIRIIDTGYIKTDNSGTQASSTNIAGAGTAVTLKTAEFIPNLKRNISISPELASNEPTEVNIGSLEDMQFKLRCVLNQDRDGDMVFIATLLDMMRTDGYKIMWYNYSATAENNNGQLIYRISTNNKFGTALTNGEKTAFDTSDNFSVLKVNLNNMQYRQTSKKLMTYEISGTVLKPEKSVV